VGNPIPISKERIEAGNLRLPVMQRVFFQGFPKVFRVDPRFLSDGPDKLEGLGHWNLDPSPSIDVPAGYRVNPNDGRIVIQTVSPDDRHPMAFTHPVSAEKQTPVCVKFDSAHRLPPETFDGG